MKTTLFVSLTMACSLAAQTTYTFPSDHASIANGTTYSANFPYAFGVSRCQAEYDAWDVTVPMNTSISRIGFRQDGTNASTGHALQLEVLMGYTNNTAATLSGTYATNYAGSMTTVFGPALFTLPTFTTAGGGVAWLNLTTPFLYHPSAGQNLLIEWRVTANNNGNASFTYYLDAANFVSTVTAGPAGCPHSGSNTATLASQPARVGGNWSLYMSNAPASSFFFLLQTPAQQLVTPYPLTGIIPGISGACMGQVAPSNLIVTNGSTNTGGAFSWNIQVPNVRSLNDMFVSSQAVILDFFAPGGMVVSNGDQMQLGIDPANTIVYSQGSTTTTTGSVYRNYGIVTLFQ